MLSQECGEITRVLSSRSVNVVTFSNHRNQISRKKEAELTLYWGKSTRVKSRKNKSHRTKRQSTERQPKMYFMTQELNSGKPE